MFPFYFQVTKVCFCGAGHLYNFPTFPWLSPYFVILYWYFYTNYVNIPYHTIPQPQYSHYKNIQNWFWSRRACVRHTWWRTKRSWPLFSHTFFFFLLLFFFFFSYAFCFSPTSGNLPCVKICFPQYFGITRRYMQKKNIFFR